MNDFLSQRGSHRERPKRELPRREVVEQFVESISRPKWGRLIDRE
jgi:hypothetical protein